MIGLVEGLEAGEADSSADDMMSDTIVGDSRHENSGGGMFHCSVLEDLVGVVRPALSAMTE